MTNVNEPAQPARSMDAPAHGGGAVDGASTFAPPAAQPGLNTMAVLALVFFVFSPLAVVFGFIGRRQIARTGERGKGLATAGLVLGVVGIALGITVATLVLRATKSVSSASLESKIVSQYEPTAGVHPDSASCPTNLPATVGASVTCTAIVAGQPSPVVIAVTAVDPDGVSISYSGG